MTPDSERASLPADTHIGRTALTVSELSPTIEFYAEVVGLTVLEETPAEATLGTPDHPLLLLRRDETADPRPTSAAGLYHTAFRVPSRAAVGDALDRIRSEWRLDGASDHLVSEALYLTDPENNGVEIYRDRPREEWPRTDDGEVRMATEPLDLEGVASAADGAERAPDGTDIGHVHLEVTGLDAVRSFYVETLGFDVQTTYPGALFVAAGGYHHHIGANVWQQRTAPRSGRGLAWFEVVLPEATTLAAVRERLQSAGIVVRDRDAGFSVKDPDDIELRVRVDDE